MTKGLDAQIDQRIDAYRNNPQQLQQRYAQNKELVDLLALQKLKSEKDAVARDMQLKQQQQPSNVKQRLEREMFNRTKDDMVKQTSGILAKRQGDQQKNLRRLAKNNPPNMSGGITGLMGMPGVSKKPVAKMLNKGGIVNFSEGRIVSALDKIALEQVGLGPLARAYERGEITKKSLDAQISEARKKIGGPSRGLQKSMFGNQPASRLDDFSPEAQTAVLPTAPKLSSSVSNFIQTGPETPQLGGITIPQLPNKFNMPTLPKDNVAVPTMPEFPEKTSAADRGIMAALQGFNAANEKIGDAGIDMGAFDMGVAKANQVTGRADKAQRFKDMQDKYAAFETANFSPEQAQFERVAGQLAAAGGATSLGQMGKQMAFTGDKIRNRQKTKAFDRMVTAFNTDIAGMKMDAELGNAALRTGETLVREAGLDSRASKSAARAGNLNAFNAALKMIELASQERTEQQNYKLNEKKVEIQQQLADIQGLNLEIQKGKLLLDGESIAVRREELAGRLKNLKNQSAMRLYLSVLEVGINAKSAETEAALSVLDNEVAIAQEEVNNLLLTDPKNKEQLAAANKRLDNAIAAQREFAGGISDAFLNNEELADGISFYDLKSMLEQNPFITEMLTGAKATNIIRE